MASRFSVRPATHAEAPALSALVNSAYRGDSSRAGWTTEADMLGGQRVDEGRIVEMVTRPGSVILVHASQGELIACVHLERTGEDCYLGMLTVQPTGQGRGIGRQLLEAAERWAVEHWSSRAMHMTVIAQRTELVAWYERRGYRITGTRKPFPYDDERSGLPKRDDLVFEVLWKSLSGAGRR
jgi:ribosomal protein S18 acetylase RimI-like enzyme